MSKDFYSTIEVAKILGVSRTSVYSWAKNGKVNATRVGRNYIIPQASVLELLGKTVGKDKEALLSEAVNKAVEQYGEAIRLLGKE